MHNILSATISIIEDTIADLENSNNENKLYIAVLKRNLIILRAINQSSINITGMSLDEFEKYMTDNEIVCIKRGEYEKMVQASSKLYEIARIIDVS